MEARTWGAAREELAELLNCIEESQDLPAMQNRYIKRAKDIVKKELRPRNFRRGHRAFGPLTAAQEAQAIHLHIGGNNDAQIALALGTAEGQVSRVIRQWITGEWEPYWPEANEEVRFCNCAFHKGTVA